MTGRDEALGICKLLKKGEPGAGPGLARAMTISDALGERMEIKWKAAKAWDTQWGVLGELDIWVTATVRVRVPSKFPRPVSCIPTKLRAELFSTALQTPSPGSASRHTRLGKTGPCLFWKGDGGLPPACHIRHCPDTWHQQWSGSKCLSWILTSHPHLMLNCIPKHLRE